MQNAFTHGTAFGAVYGTSLDAPRPPLPGAPLSALCLPQLAGVCAARRPLARESQRQRFLALPMEAMGAMKLHQPRLAGETASAFADAGAPPFAAEWCGSGSMPACFVGDSVAELACLDARGLV